MTNPMTPARLSQIEIYHWKCGGCARKCTATSLDNANPWNCHYADKSGQKWEKMESPDCLAEIERLKGLIERIATDKGGNVWATFSFNPIEEARKILETE